MYSIARPFVVVGGLVFASQALGAPPQTVSGRADHGVIAGTINGPVTVYDYRRGLSPQDLKRIQAARSDPALARKAEELGVAKGAFDAFFVIVGEKNVPPDQYEAKLIEYAGRYRDLQQSVAAVPTSTYPEIAALKAQAQAALNAGKFDVADGLLQQIETAQDSALRNQLADRSATATGRAKIAMTQLRYRDAALHFAEAAQRAPDDQAKLGALGAEAEAYFRQGDEFGDNVALGTAIRRLGELIFLRPRERVPVDWATTQVSLGIALATLGEREGGTDNLEKAAAAFKAALLVETPDQMPSLWGSAQVNLGDVLVNLGQRENDPVKLKTAVAAFTAALLVNTRDRVPLLWADTQLALGVALAKIGERENNTAILEKAVDAYTAALLEDTRDRAPLNWAKTQVDLGNALVDLGERQNDIPRLEKAVGAYTAALTVNTRDRVPLDWAGTMMELGTALTQLGARESGTTTLEKAVVAYRAALLEETRNRVPLRWAGAQVNLGYAEFLIASRRNVFVGLAGIEAKVAEARSVSLKSGDEPVVAFADFVLSQIAAAKTKPGG